MSTFSIDVPQPTAAPSLQAQPLRVGVEGGAQAAAISLADPGNGTGWDTAPLEQLGSEIYKGMQKKQQELAFYKGVQRAAVGETAADIEAERPAWASAFGDSDAVRGARYYEQITDSAKLESAVITSLPETRKLTPDQFAEGLRRNVEAIKTGDPTRDLILEGSAIQFMPGAIQMHARAHLDWNQKAAAAASAQSIESVIHAAETTGAAQRENPAAADDEVMARTNERTLSLLITPPGVEPEAHLNRVIDGVSAAVSAGQFTTYNFLRDQGLLSKLPAARRDTLIRTAEASAARHVVEKTPVEGHMAAFNLLNDYSIDGPDLLKAIDKLNAQVSVVTGVPAKLIPDGVKDAWLQRREAARDADARTRQAANKTAQDRENDRQAALLEMNSVKALINDPNTGKEGAIPALNKLTKAQQDTVLVGLYADAQALPPQQRVAKTLELAHKTAGIEGSIPESVKIPARNTASSPVWSAETDTQAAIITGMDPGSQGKIESGAGEVATYKEFSLLRSTQPELDPQTAWTMAQNAVLQRKAKTVGPLSKDEEEELHEAVLYSDQNQVLGMRSTFFFGKKTEVGMAGLMPFMRAGYQHSEGIGPQTDRAAFSMSYAREMGVRTSGGVGFVKTHKGPEWNDPKYFPGMDGPAKRDMLNSALKKSFDDLTARDSRFDPDNVTNIYHRPEVGGKTSFGVAYTYKDKEGQIKTASFILGQDAIAAEANKAQQKMDERTANMQKPATEHSIYSKQDSKALPKSIYSK